MVKIFFSIISKLIWFFLAGSDVIETNTYQASIDGFVKYLDLNASDSLNLIKEAVELAKKARDVHNLTEEIERN